MAPADRVSDGYGDLDEASRYRKIEPPELEGPQRTHMHDFRGCGPSQGGRSDASIREDVEYFLTEHDEIDATKLEVRVSSGEVSLKGVVPEAHMEVLALEVTFACRGVRSVRNEVRVAHEEEPQASYELSAKSSAADASENEDRPPSVARTALK